MVQSSETEVLGFDEWFKNMGHMDGYQHHYQDAYDTGYEAGQQSRQDEIDELYIKMKVSDSARKQLIDMKNLEIDELHTKLKSTKQSADEVIGVMSISIHKRNRENKALNQVVDELQKRIDEAINLIQPSDEISHKLYREIVKTLRGK